MNKSENRFRATPTPRTAAAFLLLLASEAPAELIAVEEFDYPERSLLTDNRLNRGTGWDAGMDGGWFTPGKTPMAIRPNPLEYAGFALNPPPGGKSAGHGSPLDFPGANRLLQAPISEGILYVSALFKPGTSGQYQGMSLSLGDKADETALSFGIQQRADLENSEVPAWTAVIRGRSGFNSYPPLLTLGPGLATDATHLLVAKINLATKQIDVYVNPASGTEPTKPSFSGSFAASNLDTIRYVGFYGWQRDNSSIDEIRVGRSFADLTAKP